MQHMVRNAIANYVCGLIDAGSAAGKLVFQDTQNNEVATLTFSKPAFAAASNGMATANPITADTNAAGGTINHVVVQDSNGNPIFICTVSYQGGGGDIQLSSIAVAVGQSVSLGSLTYTAPP